MKNGDSTFKVPSDAMRAAKQEARRLEKERRGQKIPCGRILRYWLRLGMQQEPEIKAVLP